MAISLQQVQYLAAVAEQGSLTAAAARLGVSQPALSRALASLQLDMNAKLFRRSGRKFVLTAEGEAALLPARRVLAAVEDMKLSALRKQTPPLLRIAAGEVFLIVAAEALRQLLKLNPNMHVQVRWADTPEAMSNLLRTGEVDIGFGERSAPVYGIRWAPLRQLELVVASPLGSDLPEALDIRDLVDVPLLCPTPNTVRQRTFDEMFLRAGVRPNVVLEVEDNTLIMPMVQAGVGSFFVWRFYAELLPGIEIRSLKPRHFVTVGFSYASDGNRHVRNFIDLAVGAR